MDRTLEGEVASLSGGSSGIGLAIDDRPIKANH
jgi:hypothetical protein